MTGYYLGIDGGGTKTQAVIIDADGYLRGIGTGGSSNFGTIGLEQATLNIRDTVASAALEAAVTPQSFEAAFLGIAGVVSQQDRDTVRQMAQQLNLAPEGMIGADHDCRVALAGGLAGQPGIVQILGTGASCFGLNSAGKRWMAGGWGHLIADEGSGYWLGVQAMKAATEAYDTRGRATLLHERVLAALKIEYIGQIMQRVYSDELSVSDIAGLGRLVIDAAQQGDPVAIDIISNGMNEVARCVEAVTRYLDFQDDEQRLVTIGGIFQAGQVILEPFSTAIHQVLPNCKIEESQFVASIGAGLLARQLHHASIEPAFIENLRASLQDKN